MAEHEGGFKDFFNRHLMARREELKGKVIVDVPAGSGTTSALLNSLGAKVFSFDLFPEYFQPTHIKCQRADVLRGLPFPDGAADFVICQEGIEHFSDQKKALAELSRMLKIGGRLLLTTPNYSNLRAKLSYLLAESERFGSSMPPNEIDSIWMVKPELSNDIYLGHVFLIGIQKLRVLAKLSGLNIEQVHFESFKPTSVLLFP
ncbi:MAG: class I SAM-dependent methyltransferase, partial [Ignavibacteriales bacterium]|nr:class I SAM-dependent methyltransferase [Ignavibacteriales bacterium]